MRALYEPPSGPLQMETAENAKHFYKPFAKHVVLILQNSIQYNKILVNTGLPTQVQKNDLGFTKILFLACHFWNAFFTSELLAGWMAYNSSSGNCNLAQNSWHWSEEKCANLGSRVFWWPEGKHWQEAKALLGRHLKANCIWNSVYVLVNVAQHNYLCSLQKDSGKKRNSHF